MNKLQQAYIDLGLKPGAPLEQVVERWRIVARMWHPDRAATEQEKAIAEAELKKVNGARDLIARHHQDGLHKLVGCECSGMEVEPPPQPRPQQSSAGSASTAPQPGAQSAARTQPRTTNGARKRRKPEPMPQAMAAVLTAGMVLIGMSIVKMNSGVKLRDSAPIYDGGSSFAGTNWRVSTGDGTPSTILALRPSGTNAAASVSAPTVKEEKKSEQKEERAKPAAPELPPNTSLITFVSSDGRLVSLQDGTTWALWPEEAADSFFHWTQRDRVIIKGADSMPCWLVNESRGYQAVRVTRVE